MPNLATHAPESALLTEIRQPSARLRTGIDVVQMSRMQESITKFGDRFVKRIFSGNEITYATSEQALATERFAARFAAKEAAIKAFGLADVGVDWRDIEVQRSGDGQCSLRLHGKAALHARVSCDDDVAISLSHDGDYAVAIVTALKASPSKNVPELEPK